LLDDGHTPAGIARAGEASTTVRETPAGWTGWAVPVSQVLRAAARALCSAPH